MYITSKSADALIKINETDYHIAFYENKIGIPKQNFAGKMLYMNVEPYQDIKERCKLLKTKIKAKRNAADIYNYLVDCSAFNRETEKALEIIEHIKKYGHGIR